VPALPDAGPIVPAAPGIWIAADFKLPSGAACPSMPMVEKRPHLLQVADDACREF